MIFFRCLALVSLASALRQKRRRNSSHETKPEFSINLHYDTADDCPPVPARNTLPFFKVAGAFEGPTCETVSPELKSNLDNFIVGGLAILNKRTQLQDINRPIIEEWNTSALTSSELAKDADAVKSGYRPYGGSMSYPGKMWMGSYCQPFTTATPGGNPTPVITDAKTVAENLMHRGGHERVCSDSVNQWFAAWIQLNVEDWVRGEREGEKGRQGPNLATPWWDLDSTYGTGYEEVESFRTHVNGKVDAERISTRKEIGQWAGLSALKYLFALEHNLIVDKLMEKYPHWVGNDQELFGRARLITTATVARIHTLHWTVVLLQSAVSQLGQTTLWDGAISGLTGIPRDWARALASLIPFLPKESQNTLKGIVGTNLQTAYNFAWPEEFSMVYRLHPMLPDSLHIGDTEVGMADLAKPADVWGFNEVALAMTNERACALTLQNFPDDLTNLTLFTGGPSFDLAEHDIIATRKGGMGSFNDFRRGLHLDPATSFEHLVTWGERAPTAREQRIIESLKKVYSHVEDVDAVIGMLAEPRLPESLLGISQYLVFVSFTQSRLESDPFFTTKYNTKHYTRMGLEWIKERTFGQMLEDHFNIEHASEHEWAGFMRPGWKP